MRRYGEEEEEMSAAGVRECLGLRNLALAHSKADWRKRLPERALGFQICLRRRYGKEEMEKSERRSRRKGEEEEWRGKEKREGGKERKGRRRGKGKEEARR
jgi:hypothetical protein